MALWKPSSRARTLLEHHRIRGRAYPKERYWERLYQVLEEEAADALGMAAVLDHDPTADDKVDRLREQLAWADRNNLLHRVQMFFDTMPSSGWERLD